MSQNVAEFVWNRLNEWGLSRVYGYPGDGVGGLDVALEKAKDVMDYVQVRHEEMAAFMASAHAKFTGQVGLCYATSGPGAIHLLTGLYDAKLDHVPAVAIVGQQARSALGASYQQEVDLQNLFADVTEYVATAIVPQQVRTCIDRAVRIAQAKRAVTCVIIPNDLQELEYEDAPMVHGATHTGVGYPGAATLPNIEDLRKAAEILQPGRESRDPGRRRRVACDRRGDHGGQPTQRRRRQGATRQGCSARRPAIRHRLDRPAWHQAELGSDEAVRHIFDGGVSLPV